MSFFSYMPDNIKFISCDENNPSHLGVLTVEKGCVIVNKDGRAKSGVYDKNGVLCPESITLRGIEDIQKNTQKINISKLPFIDDTVLYLGSGRIFSHFGHFLIEGLGRTWALLYKKYKNIKVVVSWKKNENMPIYVRKFLNAVGVPDENILILRKSTSFARVIVPQQATNIFGYILPEMKKVFNKIALSMNDKKYKTYDKIYLSRSSMNDGRTFGEKSVEKIFKKMVLKLYVQKNYRWNIK